MSSDEILTELVTAILNDADYESFESACAHIDREASQVDLADAFWVMWFPSNYCSETEKWGVYVERKSTEIVMLQLRHKDVLYTMNKNYSDPIAKSYKNVDDPIYAKLADGVYLHKRKTSSGITFTINDHRTSKPF